MLLIGTGVTKITGAGGAVGSGAGGSGGGAQTLVDIVVAYLYFACLLLYVRITCEQHGHTLQPPIHVREAFLLQSLQKCSAARVGSKNCTCQNLVSQSFVSPFLFFIITYKTVGSVYRVGMFRVIEHDSLR